MVNIANINIWDKQAGILMHDPATGVVSFEYLPEFVRDGYDLSPLFVPRMSGRVFTFPALPYDSFKGLPGFIADALPDKFGDTLINQWLIREGRAPGTYNIVERLLYQGSRAMGALVFEPETRKDLNRSVSVELDGLVEAALTILNERTSFVTNANAGEEAITTILRVGTSAGGARAKAVVAYNPQTGEIRSGQTDVTDGFEHYLLKLDGVTNGSLGDPMHYGSIEYGYYRMARDCGIDMNESMLLNDGKRRHFLTKRFDRKGNHRIHMCTLCGIAHIDFNHPGISSYEEAFAVMRQLHLTAPEAEQLYRRMVFNVVGRNQDDHTKNISFLLDTDNQWRLAPAYDMTYAYNPVGSYTSMHQMAVNGKRDNITREDMLRVAENIHLKKANKIIDEIVGVFERFDDYMEPDIPEKMVDEMRGKLRRNI